MVLVDDEDEDGGDECDDDDAVVDLLEASVVVDVQEDNKADASLEDDFLEDDCVNN